jgi:hypothetical protein
MNTISIQNAIDQDAVENDIYTCPICGDLFRNPQIDKCGHTFCHFCIVEFLQLNSKCPLSKLELKRRDLTPNVTVRDLVSGLMITCPQSKVGCAWSGTIADCLEHVEQCALAVVDCEFECNQVVQRFQLEEHLQTCSFRLVTCLECLENIPLIYLNRHKALECSCSIVDCPLSCGIYIVNRLMDQHTTSECPNRFVKCPFVKFGCWFESKKKNLSCHIIDSTDYHLKLQNNFAQAGYSMNSDMFTTVIGHLTDKNSDTQRSLWQIKQRLSMVKVMIPGRQKINKTKLKPQLTYKKGLLRCLPGTEPNTVLFIDRVAQPFERVSMKIKALPSGLNSFSLAIGLANKCVHRPLLNTKYEDINPADLVVWPNNCPNLQGTKDTSGLSSETLTINFRQNDVLSFYYDGKCEQIIFENLSSQKVTKLAYPKKWRESFPILIVSEGVELTLVIASCAIKMLCTDFE